MAAQGQIASFIDPYRFVDMNYAVVSLVIKQGGTDHAMLIIESFDLSAEYELMICDFVPEGTLGGVGSGCVQVASAYVIDAVVAGEVREDRLHVKPSSRDQFFKEKKWNIDNTSSWRLEIAQTRQLIARIIQQKDKEIPVPQFCLRGIRHNAKGHNCTTWAQAELALVGVDAVATGGKTPFKDCFVAAKPSRHVGTVGHNPSQEPAEQEKKSESSCTLL